MSVLVLFIFLATGCIERLRETLKEGHHIIISKPLFIILATVQFDVA